MTRQAVGRFVSGLLLVAGGATVAASSVMSSARAADLAAPAPVVAAEAQNAWTVQLNEETRFFDFHGSRGDPATLPNGLPATGGRGFQIYTPTTLSAGGLFNDKLRFDGSIRSGYVSSHQTTPGLEGGVSTITDTVPTFTLTYLGIDGYQPFFSLSANLPTGKPAVFGLGVNGRLDPDLVDVATFGEGFNIGPTLGVNIPLNPETVLTLSGAFTSRGDYQQEGAFVPGTPQVTNRTHPGDIATGTASLSTQLGQLSFQASFNFSHFGKVQSNGADQLETGNQLSLSTVFGYAFDDHYSLRAIASFSYNMLNRVQNPIGGVLFQEPFNTNSLVSSIRLEPTYAYDKFTIGPVASAQYRDANSYDPTTLQFVPAKVRQSLGAQGTYRLTPTALINVRYEHVWTQVDDAMASIGLPSISRNGNIGVIGGTLTF